MRSSRTSLRSRANSSRWAVVSPVRPFVRSARACSTQLRSDDSVNPRSRAAAATVLISSRTSRTAPALSSSVKSAASAVRCAPPSWPSYSSFERCPENGSLTVRTIRQEALKFRKPAFSQH